MATIRSEKCLTKQWYKHFSEKYTSLTEKKSAFAPNGLKDCGI